MNLIRRAWTWLTTPRKDVAQEALKAPNFDYDQHAQTWMADEHERDHRRSLETIPPPPDLTDDPDTDVPPAHLGAVQHLDLTQPVAEGEPAPSILVEAAEVPQDSTPMPALSDWDLLSEQDKELFNELGDHDEGKIVRYPAPVEQPTAAWVSEQLAKAGYSEAYRLRFAGFRRVAAGMSMRHLNDLKRRADARDSSLSVHDLIALRSRGIA